jgi:malate dehydrogenase (oxaloacetate-decarboxylating)
MWPWEGEGGGGPPSWPTGRSDFPNQCQQQPYCFRLSSGEFLDIRAKTITDTMVLHAAWALANYVPEEKLTPDYIIPNDAGMGGFTYMWLRRWLRKRQRKGLRGVP